MAAPKAFLFVDSSPASTDTRNRELRRAEALSHAAKVSHRTNRQVDSSGAAKRKSAVNTQIPTESARPQQDAAPTRWTKDPDGGREEGSPHPSRKRGGRSYAVQRWRLGSEKPLRERGLGGIPTGFLPSRGSTAHCTESMEMTIPIHKGNSDPFNSTSIPFTAFDLSLVRDDRRSLVDIVWPAEISMRKNHPSLLDRMWTVMPSILDSPAVVHAVVSHAHYSRAIRYLASGQRDQNALVLAEQHKLRAMRNLRNLLETYRQSGGLDLLKQIRGASSQLAACGVISGDVGSAQIHFAGVKMAIDLMGGLRNISPVQSECLVFSQVASAWFDRSRPVFHPDEWDPGPWSGQRLAFCEPLSSLSESNTVSPWLQHSRPSAISPEMRGTIDQIRELLHVEDVKLALASSKDEMATQVFRWSGLRKLAVRARNLGFWCDFKEDMKTAASGTGPTRGFGADTTCSLPAPFDMVVCLTVRCFDRAIFEEHYYIGDSPFRLSKTFLAEVAAYLQRLNPPFPDIDGMHSEGSNHQRILEDERRYDMLWVCSVGAHIEEYHLGLARRSSFAPSSPSLSPFPFSATGQRTQDMVGGGGLFASGFVKLVKTLGFEGFDDVATFLTERYLYCPRLQDATLRKLVPLLP